MSRTTSISFLFTKLVSERAENELSDWLLAGFSTGSFEPLWLHDEPSHNNQLKHLFDDISPNLKAKFKRAVICASIEWHITGYSHKVLRDIAILSAYVKASGIVKVLQTKLESDELDRLKGDRGQTPDSYYDLVQILIAVLRGFLPKKDVGVLFKRLFFSETFDPRFAGQLLLGLCECDPENYTLYLPRFMQLEAKYHGQFLLHYIAAEMERIITLRTAAAKINKLDSKYQEEFLKTFCSYQWSPANLIYDPQFGYALTSRRETFQTERQVFPIKSKMSICWQAKVTEMRCSSGAVEWIRSFIEDYRNRLMKVKTEDEKTRGKE